MSRLHTAFILGYHGCSKETGEDVLAGRSVLKSSNEKYDWLGPGIYFWQADPIRAFEWAKEKVERGVFGDPFVIGAAIDLGNCLDLMAREDLELVRVAYDGLKKAHDMYPDAGPLPENKPLGDGDGENLLRYLDCATISFLHLLWDKAGNEPFDSVRGLFTEGKPLFPGSGFKKKTHTQIAVCNHDCIKGYFRVRPEELRS